MRVSQFLCIQKSQTGQNVSDGAESYGGIGAFGRGDIKDLSQSCLPGAENALESGSDARIGLRYRTAPLDRAVSMGISGCH
jgi:hypothetical protein